MNKQINEMKEKTFQKLELKAKNLNANAIIGIHVNIKSKNSLELGSIIISNYWNRSKGF